MHADVIIQCNCFTCITTDTWHAHARTRIRRAAHPHSHALTLVQPTVRKKPFSFENEFQEEGKSYDTSYKPLSIPLLPSPSLPPYIPFPPYLPYLPALLSPSVPAERPQEYQPRDSELPADEPKEGFYLEEFDGAVSVTTTATTTTTKQLTPHPQIHTTQQITKNIVCAWQGFTLCFCCCLLSLFSFVVYVIFHLPFWFISFYFISIYDNILH